MSVVEGGSSFGGSASGGSSLMQARVEEKDAVATSTFWNGFFGTLYTVNKGRRCGALFFTFKLAMEFLQIAFLMMDVQYGWLFDSSSKGWQFVEFIQVRPFMARIGHSLFVISFVAFLLLLVALMAIYAWSYYCFQNNKFDYAWPLRLARVFGAVFFECLDVMAMSLMLTAIDGRYYGWPSGQRLFNNEFPTLESLKMPNVIYLMVAVLGVLIFVTLAGFNKLSQMDLNPATRILDAYAHPGTELWVLTFKMLIVLASVLLGDYRHLAIFWLICSTLLCYFFWKWEPMVYPWVNYLRMGSFTAIMYISCVFMALQFPPDSVKAALDAGTLGATYSTYTSYVKALEIALVGVFPAFAVGGVAAFLQLRHYRVTLTNKFRDAAPGAKARTIHKFSSPREVEIVSRCCRVWADADTLQPEAVALAEKVLKAGLVSLPNSPWMIVWYTSFLVDVQGSFQSGFTQLQVALKLDPSFIDSYAIFSHEQDHSQKSANNHGGQRDVLSDVEFQKNFRLALRAHKDALRALQTFWLLMEHSQVQFENLVKAVRQIDKHIHVAERTYRSVLQRHSDQPRLLRLYAKFLDKVKHDPWGAAKWTAEAEKLDLVSDDQRQGNVFGLDEQGGDIGAGHVSRFSIGEDGQERALCVFSAAGLIAMTNEAMREMFGYAKAELKGKSVSALMPPPFSDKAIKEIKNFVHAGRGAVVIRSSEIVAVHKDRHMFGARIAVVRISGIGEDSMFLASLEVIAPQPDTATVWVLTSGQVLSADASFRDWFGYSPLDIEGASTSSLTPNFKELDGVLKSGRHALLLASHDAADAQDASEEQDDGCNAGEAMALLAESNQPGQKAKSIAQALALALAPPPAAMQSDGVCSEWMLQDVRMYHKFADCMEADVRVVNSRSTIFTMHVLTLRRCGPEAAKPMPHMLVTNPAGAVLHVTEAFTTLLGTTPKAVMSNGNHNALEALMVQPFGLIHRAGLSASMPSMQPPAYSCRSGLSVLMPITDSRIPDALPIKMQMKKRTGLDEAYFVCMLQPSTWEQALDERSLRLVVDETGVVKAVGASPSTLFNVHPGALLGRNVMAYVDIFRGEGGAGPVLQELSLRADDAPGEFWRASVGPSDFADEMQAAEVTKQSKTFAAVMTVTRMVNPVTAINATRSGAVLDVNEAEDLLLQSPVPAAKACFELRLWRADMVTSVVEVDLNGIVMEGEPLLQKLYPAGAALGLSAGQMLGEHVRDFIPLGGRKHMDLFEEGAFPPVPVRGAAANLELAARKKSNIKAMPNPEARRVGPPVLLSGRNRMDGLAMSLTAQIVRKGNQGSYLIVRPFNPTPGRVNLLEHLSKNGLSSVDMEVPASVIRRSTLYDSAEGAAPGAGRRSSVVCDPSLCHAPAVPTGSSMRKRSSFDLVAASAVGDPATQPPHGSSLAGITAVRFTNEGGGGGERDAEPAAAAAATSAAAANHSVVSEKEANVSTWIMSSGAEYMPPTALKAEAKVDNGGRGQPADVDSDEDDLGLLPVKGSDGSHGGSEDEQERSNQTATHGNDPGSGRHASFRDGKHGAASGKQRFDDDNGSQLDDATNAPDDSDYRRGSRLKKLNRLFNSELVTRYTTRFKWHSCVVWLVLCVASAIVFVIMNQLIAQQVENVNSLDYIGLCSRRAMRAVVEVQDMAHLYQPWPNRYLRATLPGKTNSVADLQTWKTKVTKDTAEVLTYTLGIFEGFKIKQRLPEDFFLRALWEDPVLDELELVMIPDTEVGMNSTTFVTPNGTWHPVRSASKTSMFDGMQKTIDHLHNVIDNSDWYNATLKPGQAWYDWPSVVYMRENMDALYSLAFVYTLDSFAQVAVAKAVQLNDVQMVILVAEGCVLAGLALAYMCYLSNAVNKSRYNLYCVFLAVPLNVVRNLAHSRADLGEADSDDDEDGVNVMRNATAQAMAEVSARSATAATGSSGSKAAKQVRSSGGDATAIAFGSEAVAKQQTLVGRVAWAMMFWRRSPKAPQERRRLTRSMRGVLWLVWPFMIWGVGIILINALGHQQLGGVEGPMMTFNIAHSMMLKMWRIIHEVGMIEYKQNVTASAAELSYRLKEVKLDYRCMCYGHDAVPEQNTSHYTLVKQGISTINGPGQYYLYEYPQCMASSASACPQPTDVFYFYMMNGMDTLFSHAFDVVEQIIAILQSGVMITIDGPEYAFLWRARDSLTGASTLLISGYRQQVINVYQSTLTLQTAALIVTLVMAVAYCVFITRPYLQEVSSERRRVTELLTQLPMEVDIEASVQRALLGRADKADAMGNGNALTAADPQAGGAVSALKGARSDSLNNETTGFLRFTREPMNGMSGGSLPKGRLSIGGVHDSAKDVGGAPSMSVLASGGSQTPLISPSQRGARASLRASLSINRDGYKDNAVVPSRLSIDSQRGLLTP